jgi:hypothetical protein
LLTPDDVFRLHAKIRWTALALESGMVVFSKMRSGIESFTSDDEDRAFMQTGPLFMTSMAVSLTPLSKAGKLECVIACFEKDCVLMAKVQDGFVAMSAETSDALAVFNEVKPKILSLWS